MSATRKRAQERDQDTGQYGHEGGRGRVCVCGHELGIHLAMAPHGCIAQDAHNMDPQRYPTPMPFCDCERFRKRSGLNERQLDALRKIGTYATGVQLSRARVRLDRARMLERRGLITLHVGWAKITDAGRALLAGGAK